MKKINENSFINVLSNVIISLIVLVIVLLSFGTEIKSVFGSSTEKPYYYGNRNTKNVTLMVNVYWGTEYVDGMLDAFDDAGVKTTFFIGGTWADQNPEMTAKIFKRGHELANHGYFHKDHKNLNVARNREEIFNTESLIQALTGVKTTLFAPPSGSFSDITLQVAKDLGYRTIMWSKDTIDWRDKDNSLIYKRATTSVEGGDLILMHPTAETVIALPRILKYYRENGFKVVPVSENIKEEIQE